MAVPLAGPSTQLRPAQHLPQATANLLHNLAPVHSLHFPRLAHAVRPDTQELDTQEARQDAEHKVALLKSVLGGWMQGVEMDLESDQDLATTSENLLALAATLPGSFCGIKAKPRYLVHTSRPLSSSARVPPSPVLVNGSPVVPSNAPAATTPGVTVDGLNPEEDLATFLVWRCLSVGSALQAALLGEGPPQQQREAAPEVVEKVKTERKAALRELEEMVQGVVAVLAESAVRVQWRGPYAADLMKDGGMGKAKELVGEMIKLVKSLLPGTQAPAVAYPRKILLFESSRAYQAFHRSPSKSHAAVDFFRTSSPSQPSIIVKSPAHARALVLTTFRILLTATTSSLYLADFRPLVVELLLASWPSPTSFRLAETPLDALVSRKGKERADLALAAAAAEEQLSHLRNVFAREWLDLAVAVLERKAEAFKAREAHLVGVRALDELRARLSGAGGDAMDVDGADSRAREEVAKELDDRLLSIFVKLGRQEQHSGDVSSSTSELYQLVFRFLASDGDRLVDALVSTSDLSLGLRCAALVVLSLPLSAHSLGSLTPFQVLSDAALRTLDKHLQRHPDLPFSPLPPNHATSVATAYARILADYDVRHSAPAADLTGAVGLAETSTSNARKRRRLDAPEAAPSSDGFMDIDGAAMPPSTAMRRKRGPWREAVETLIQQAKRCAGEKGDELVRRVLEDEGDGEAIEQKVVRFTLTLTDASSDSARDMLRIIGLLSCARSGSLVFPSSDLTSCNSSQTTPTCKCCDAIDPLPSPSPFLSQAAPISAKDYRTFTRDPLAAIQTVASAMLDPARSSEKLRLAFLATLPRVLRHSTVEVAAASALLNLLGKELEGTTRSGRLAAGNVIVAIVQAQQEFDPTAEYVKDLFISIDGVRTRDSPAVTEATLTLIGRLARIAEPQGLLECECLARLIRCLGNRNAFLKSTAKLQLVQTASHRGIKPYALVQPHFAALSPVIVSTSSTLSAALDCFHQSRDSLLRVTREHTLPLIILNDQQSLLAQIAEASGATIPEMLCNPPVAAAIVATLFMQSDQAKERGLKVLLRECRGVVLAKLVESINIPLVYKLALELGDDPAISAQAERALKAVERVRLGVTSKTKIELSDILKNAIVGLLSHMNLGLRDAAHHRPLRDKQKIIRSLEEVTKLVGPAIAGFSPQIMATLQTALATPGLRTVTLRAFQSFMQSLKFTDIGPFIGPTTAAFVRLWPDLTEGEKAVAAATIDYIVLENGDNLSRYVQDVADLSHIPELSRASRCLQRTRSGWTFENWCGHLLDRITSENDVVMFQALKELKELMEKDAASLQALSSGDSFDTNVGRLVEVLLGAAVKDGPEDKPIRNIACECIGILGAVDPDRFELPPVEQPPIVLENFDDHEESVNFALRLIQDLLVGAYRSTNDTKHQEFLAYAIQELLRFCGFTPSLVLASNSAAPVDPATQARWNALPKTVLEACAPLLSTSFSLGGLQAMPPATFPIYSSTSTYRDWIRSFANELYQKATGSTARQIFDAFSGLLHLEDTVVAQHLLPHLVLNVLICGSDDDRSKVKVEMETVLTDQVSPTHNLPENSRLLAAQTVFSLMDHLSRWITLARKRQTELKNLRKKNKTKSGLASTFNAALLSVEGILQDIPHILVGQAALTCKSYARSLLNFESHIVAQRAQKGNDKDKDLQAYYENLHECYADLDEPDGMEGISTKIISPSILHQIREHEMTGRWTSAQSCWEVKLQQKPDEPANHVGLLRCLRNLGHYDSMRTHIAGLLHSRGDEVDWERILAPFNIEASLFVGDWDAVEDSLDIADLEGPEAAFGRVLCAMKAGDEAHVEKAFFEAREQLGGPIVAAGRESYRRVYDSVIHLHVLQELKAIHLSHRSRDANHLPQLVKTLRDRLAATSPTFRSREPVLNLRRTAFRLAPSSDAAAKTEVGELWLETSKIARKAGHAQTAYSAILQARDCAADYAFLQSAKLLKAGGQTYKAIQELDNRLKPILANFKPDDAQDPLQSWNAPGPLAKASLRRARWMLEAGRVEQNDAIALFKEAGALAPNWESPLYYLGHFWDQMADANDRRAPGHQQKRSPVNSRNASMRVQVVKMFSKALGLGTKFIYQAMPRMLTIWLEIAEHPSLVQYAKMRAKDPKAQPDGELYDLSRYFDKINDFVLRCAGKSGTAGLPPYQWLTVLPQLVSRILHPNEALFQVLEQILLKVLRCYPHHGFWAMASGAKSNTSRRSKRNLRVFQKAKEASSQSRASGSANVGVLVDEGLKLVDQLLYLCNYSISGKVDTLRGKKTFPDLYRLAPTHIIIPLQSSLTVSLPFDASQAASYKPFPDNLPVFHEFEDQINIMSSLQKPRKITVRGDDGKLYSFLCKPKDDLRKDARLMEFNAMIIKLLKKDSEARSRKLNIRTYSVVPLNEECGLIEWVPHVVVLRGVLNKAYGARGIASWSPELKRIFDTIRDDPKRIGERFDNEVLTAFPPVFHDWFLENFPEPSAWHRARLAYSRTAAVISMVGFVLGLGDRHCENILLDGTTGDTVHVDFNCLFDKGRTFEVPEKVPFRLTTNIIDGMGVTGVEGVYRRSAEITLRILRANKDSLRSVLETFLHDPLVEWVGRKSRDTGTELDQTKAKALESLEPISNKLLGLQVTSDPDSLGAKEVTVEEQVERLIREARDPKNLGSMYVGWCAWY
ncbi:hypothetical protein JCM1841_002451 [Sporobolomyces salmonicolor]